MRSQNPLRTCLLALVSLSCSTDSDDAAGTDSTSTTDLGTTSAASATLTDPDTTSAGPSAETSGPAESSSGEVVDETANTATSGGEDTLEYAGDMNGYRWELPCEDPSQRDTCPWDPALLEGAVKDPSYTLRRETAVTFGGDPTVVYDVQIRIRGLVEPKDFADGMVQENHFQIGGTPGTNDYNIYAIEVGDPLQVYTLNRNEMGIGHYTFILDYTVTIPIRGGTEVVMAMSDPNNIAIANPGGASGSVDPFVVPEIPPFPDPFYGQFIQMDVLAVTAR
jgi:hypothetical protein